MTKFNFKIRDESGALRKGVIEATDVDTAAERLMEMNYVIISISPFKENFFSLDFRRGARVPRKDLMIFYLQMATLINAGVTLIECLEALGEQCENPGFKDIILTIRRDVLSGNSFSEALTKHPRVFNKLFVALIKAGETGGMLPEILESIAGFTEREEKLKSRIRGAMAYPIIMLLASVGVVVFLLTFVFPKFKTIFSKIGGGLPLPTKILIVTSDFLVAHFTVLLFIVVVSAFVIIYLTRYTKRGVEITDMLFLKLPLVGILNVKVNISRFTRILGTLLKNGVPIITALEVTNETMDNTVFDRIVRKTIEKVQEGAPLADPLEASKVFPPMVVKMVKVGERAGIMSEMMIKVGDFYENEVQMSIDTMIGLLEPIMIVTMGILVGFIALAMFLPMFDMTKMLKN